MSFLDTAWRLGYSYQEKVWGSMPARPPTGVYVRTKPIIDDDDEFLADFRNPPLSSYYKLSQLEYDELEELYKELKTGKIYFELTGRNTVFKGSIVCYTGTLRHLITRHPYAFRMEQLSNPIPEYRYHFDKSVSNRKFDLFTDVKWLKGYTGPTDLKKINRDNEKKIPKDMFGYDMDVGSPVIFYYQAYYKTSSLLKLGVIKKISDAGVVTVSCFENNKSQDYVVRRPKNDLMVATEDLYSRILVHKLST